jgi:peptide chain release factor 3
MPGQKLEYAGIPTFAPEHFARVTQVDTLKRKQFIKGTAQIAQEGAIQIFQEPLKGMEEVIVGVVGVLQFEILEYRLKNEYGVAIRRKASPTIHRWIENEFEESDLKSLTSLPIRKLYRISKAVSCCFSQRMEYSLGAREKSRPAPDRIRTLVMLL